MRKSKLPVKSSKEDQSSVLTSQRANEKVRCFLTCFVILLPVLAFIGFLLTGNIAVLMGGTVLSVPLHTVFAYYFPLPQHQDSKER
jgi:hypothetical protein